MALRFRDNLLFVSSSCHLSSAVAQLKLLERERMLDATGSKKLFMWSLTSKLPSVCTGDVNCKTSRPTIIIYWDFWDSSVVNECRNQLISPTDVTML